MTQEPYSNLPRYTQDGLPVINLEILQTHGRDMLKPNDEEVERQEQGWLDVIRGENPVYYEFIRITAQHYPADLRRPLIRDLASAYMLFRKQAEAIRLENLYEK